MSDTESKALEEEKLALAIVGIGVVFAQTLVSLNQESGALPLLRERAEAMSAILTRYHHLPAR